MEHGTFQELLEDHDVTFVYCLLAARKGDTECAKCSDVASYRVLIDPDLEESLPEVLMVIPLCSAHALMVAAMPMVMHEQASAQFVIGELRAMGNGGKS
jgi:hypothetical protein